MKKKKDPLSDLTTKIKSSGYGEGLNSIQTELGISAETKHAAMEALLLFEVKRFYSNNPRRMDIALLALGLLSGFNNRYDRMESSQEKNLYSERRDRFLQKTNFISINYKKDYGVASYEEATQKVKEVRKDGTKKMLIDTIRGSLDRSTSRHLNEVISSLYNKRDSINDWLKAAKKECEEIAQKKHIRIEWNQWDHLPEELLPDLNYFHWTVPGTSCSSNDSQEPGIDREGGEPPNNLPSDQVHCDLLKLKTLLMELSDNVQRAVDIVEHLEGNSFRKDDNNLDFCKTYVIKLIQVYCKDVDQADNDKNAVVGTREDKAELMLAAYGLLQGFTDSDQDNRMQKYYNYAHEYSSLLKGTRESESITSTCGEILKNITLELTSTLCDLETQNGGKLGLIEQVPETLILPSPRSKSKQDDRLQENITATEQCKESPIGKILQKISFLRDFLQNA